MKACYGTIFPNLAEFQFGKEVAGAVFHVQIDTRGPNHRDRRLSFDLPQWQVCERCEQFEGCYKLSHAKLAIQQAVSTL